MMPASSHNSPDNHESTKSSRDVSRKSPAPPKHRKSKLLKTHKNDLNPKIREARFNRMVQLMTGDSPIVSPSYVGGKIRIGPMAPLSQPQPQPPSVLDEHNYFISKRTVIDLQETLMYLEPMCEVLKEQTRALKQVINSKDKDISMLTPRSSTANVIDGAPFRLKLSHFTQNLRAFKFFTGFDEMRHFRKLLAFLRPAYTAVLGRSARSANMLPLGDQLFLALCRLRLGYSDREVARNFHLSVVAYDQIWEFWLHFLNEQFAGISIWPKERPRKIILDCMKICGTSKCLIAVQPDGAVCFISDSYGLHLSELEIVRRCGILGLMDSGDQIFVDGGFDIENLIEGANIDLYRTYNLDNKRFCGDEMGGNVVERIVKALKEFKILISTNAPWTLKVWRICCCLMHFRRDDFVPRKIL